MTRGAKRASHSHVPKLCSQTHDMACPVMSPFDVINSFMRREHVYNWHTIYRIASVPGAH